MVSGLGLLNAFLTYNSFNLQWVYWDLTPSLSQGASVLESQRLTHFLFSRVHNTNGITNENVQR